MFDLTICCSHVAGGTVIIAIKLLRTFLILLDIINVYIRVVNKFSFCFFFWQPHPRASNK